MRVLVTGAAGFVGSHMLEHFIMGPKNGLELFGADRWHANKRNISHLEGRFNYREYDMTDYSSTRRLLMEARPERIYHLAAQSFVPTSWNAPADTLHNNIQGQLNLFEAVRELGLDPVIQIACSSEEYGLVHPKETPIIEDQPLRPLSPYAVSKIAQDFMGYQYWQSYGMKVVRTRAFNHTGPRRGEHFATSAFAKQIAEIEIGKAAPVVKVGNLEAERDFTDVRDMVRAYTLAELCEPGHVYNICTGHSRSMQSVLDMLVGYSTRAREIRFEEDPARLRPSDVPLLRGDNSRFVFRTGWKPEITFEQTMIDLLDYWRVQVRKP